MKRVDARRVAEAVPSPHAAFVAYVLAGFADENGLARPGVEALMGVTHFPRSTVLQHLAELKRNGDIIKVADGRGRSRATVWYVPVPGPEKVRLAGRFSAVKGPAADPEKVRRPPVKGPASRTSRGKAEEKSSEGFRARAPAHAREGRRKSDLTRVQLGQAYSPQGEPELEPPPAVGAGGSAGRTPESDPRTRKKKTARKKGPKLPGEGPWSPEQRAAYEAALDAQGLVDEGGP